MLLGTIMLGFGGCVHGAEAGSNPALEPAPPMRASLGVPCPELQDRRGSTPATLVFVEAADIAGVESTQDVGGGNVAAVPAVANALATIGETAVLPWHPCSNAACTEREDWQLRIETKAASETRNLIAVEVSLAAQGKTPSKAAASEIHDQATVVLAVPEPRGDSELRLALTPYLLADRGDLAALFQCKKRNAQSAGITNDVATGQDGSLR